MTRVAAEFAEIGIESLDSRFGRSYAPGALG
jgi:hypothetical protein